MPFDETREQHRAAAYLPRPLYVLYMQGSAYKDACGKSTLCYRVVKSHRIYLRYGSITGHSDQFLSQ